MALINKSAILQHTLRELDKLSSSQSIGLYSYKRNRRVLLLKVSEDNYVVKVDGYLVFEKQIGKKALVKSLRSIIKREFPRSRKIRCYKFSATDNAKPFQKI